MTDTDFLTSEPGLYRIWFDLEVPSPIRVGALGEIMFPEGRYAYTGSAKGGIRARVARHMRADGPKRWHIDYVLPHGRVITVEAHPHAAVSECVLSADPLAWPEVEIAAHRFGASDCRCAGHLIRMPRWMPVPLYADVRTPDGTAIRVRLLRPDDRELLGDYFTGLGERTRSRYGPHAFDRATARAICDGLDPRDMLRIVAAVGEPAEAKLVAYLLVKLGIRESNGKRYAALGIDLDPRATAALAPSVADAWQNRGVASAVMPTLLAMARSVGVRRLVLWDGVIADNHLAQGFYRKWGFVKVGEFMTSVLNYDMIAEIPETDGISPASPQAPA